MNRFPHKPSLDLETQVMELVVLGKKANLFRQHKVFNAGLRAFAQTGDQGLYDFLVRLCYETGFFKGRLKSRAFNLPYSQEDIAGNIQLGRVIDTPFTYCHNISDLPKHGLIVGQPGVGKTEALKTLALPVIKAGHQVCIFDPKGCGDFNAFIRYGVLYIPVRELRFNILDPPKNVPINVWDLRIAEALSEAFRILEASFGHLASLIRKTNEKWLPKGITPCFKELYDEVFTSSGSRGKTGDYDAVIRNRMQTTYITLPDVLCCRKGFVNELVEHESFIIDLSGISGIAQNVIAECLMVYIYEYYRCNPLKKDES